MFKVTVKKDEVRSYLSTVFANGEIRVAPIPGTPWMGCWNGRNWIGSRSVSSQFIPHQDEHIVRLAETVADTMPSDNVHLTGDWHPRDGHRLLIKEGLSHEERRYRFENDQVWQAFLLRAPYGGGSCHLQAPVYRDACANLQMLRLVSVEVEWRIAHNSLLAGRYENVIRSIDASESFSALRRVEQQMKEAEVDLAAAIVQLLPHPSKEGEVDEKTKDHVVQRLRSEWRHDLGRDRGFKVPLWNLYQALQGSIQHDGTRRGSTGAFDRAVKGLDDPRMRRLDDYVEAVIAG